MFLELFEALRARGLPVSVGDWLGLLGALEQALITDLDELYRVGRALVCRSESDYDAWDLAFSDAFSGHVLPGDLRERLEAWLARRPERPDGPWLGHDHASLEELWRALEERLAAQESEHHGGNRWVGTGGRSPFGHSGRGARGIRIGGPGGGRQAIAVAQAREWRQYRTDTTLQTRDLEVALRALRRLVREGAMELDLDGTIRKTAANAGEIELVEHRARQNQVRLVLLMDIGGSMTPHSRRVEQLLTAAAGLGVFKSFETYSFHNCVYDSVWRTGDGSPAVPTSRVLDGLTSSHRLLFVGDASMAPWELFGARWGGADGTAGVDWLRRLRQRCPASVWLNPDPRRSWDHPTVSAIGGLFSMHELTVEGLTRAVRELRAPH